MMDTSAVHDGASREEVFKRRLLRVVAELLECVAVMWVPAAGGYFFAIAIAPRVSDAIADAMPLALAGGVGFTLVWWTASVSRHSSESAAPRTRKSPRRADGP